MLDDQISMMDVSTCIKGVLPSSFSTAASMRDGFEELIVTIAPFSTHASATAKPMPDEPPMIRMRVPASLLVYFFWSDMMVSMLF